MRRKDAGVSEGAYLLIQPNFGPAHQSCLSHASAQHQNPAPFEARLLFNVQSIYGCIAVHGHPPYAPAAQPRDHRTCHASAPLQHNEHPPRSSNTTHTSSSYHVSTAT
eukprot:1161024-Pelagomonas_calceolata.AAC.10